MSFGQISCQLQDTATGISGAERPSAFVRSGFRLGWLLYSKAASEIQQKEHPPLRTVRKTRTYFRSGGASCRFRKERLPPRMVLFYLGKGRAEIQQKNDICKKSSIKWQCFFLFWEKHTDFHFDCILIATCELLILLPSHARYHRFQMTGTSSCLIFLLHHSNLVTMKRHKTTAPSLRNQN